MVYFFTLVSLSAFTVQASVLVGRSPLSSLLVGRQNTPIDPTKFPAQCQTMCTPISNTINNCGSLQCLCTPSNAGDLQSCISCVVGVNPATESQGKAILDGFTSSCTGGGITLSPLSITAVSSATGTSGGGGVTSSFSRSTVSSSGDPSETASTPSSAPSLGPGANNPFGKFGGAVGLRAGNALVAAVLGVAVTLLIL